MPQPTDFFPNEAWVLFLLNDTPIRTELHGDFNCFSMMDAASAFILGTTLIPADQAELTVLDAKRLFKLGAEHKLPAPRTLFMPKGLAAQSVAQEAHRLGVEVSAISPEEMAPFVAEAKAGFKQYQDRRSAGD